MRMIDALCLIAVAGFLGAWIGVELVVRCAL